MKHLKRVVQDNSYYIGWIVLILMGIKMICANKLDEKFVIISMGLDILISFVAFVIIILQASEKGIREIILFTIYMIVFGIICAWSFKDVGGWVQQIGICSAFIGVAAYFMSMSNSKNTK